MQVNSYIAILATPKHKIPRYSSGAKGKIFTFIATVQSYIRLYTIAEKKLLFYLHTTFFIFYSFLLSFSFLYVSLLTASPSLQQFKISATNCYQRLRMRKGVTFVGLMLNKKKKRVLLQRKKNRELGYVKERDTEREVGFDLCWF